MRIVVLGVGNILLSDEGVGVRALERLKRDYRLPSEVEAVDGGTSGMELLEFLACADHLVIVDAVRSGKPPGTIIRVSGDDVPKLFRTGLSPHQIGLSDVLAALALIGEQPGSTTIVGVEPASLDIGMALSTQVDALLPELAERLAGELRALGCVVPRAETVAGVENA